MSARLPGGTSAPYHEAAAGMAAPGGVQNPLRAICENGSARRRRPILRMAGIGRQTVRSAAHGPAGERAARLVKGGGGRPPVCPTERESRLI